MASKTKAAAATEASPKTLTHAGIMEAIEQDDVVERMGRSLKTTQFESPGDLRRLLKRALAGPAEAIAEMLPPGLASLLGLGGATTEAESTVLTLDCSKLVTGKPPVFLRFDLDTAVYSDGMPSVYLADIRQVGAALVMPIMVTTRMKPGEEETGTRTAEIEVVAVPSGEPLTSGPGGVRWSFVGLLPNGMVALGRVKWKEENNDDEEEEDDDGEA